MLTFEYHQKAENLGFDFFFDTGDKFSLLFFLVHLSPGLLLKWFIEKFNIMALRSCGTEPQYYPYNLFSTVFLFKYYH